MVATRHTCTHSGVFRCAHWIFSTSTNTDSPQLEECTTYEEFKGLEKPHPLFPDRQFSYSIEDFLYPAHRLGLIDRLIWVAPPHVQTGYSQAAFSQLQQMDGVRFDDFSSFKKVSGGWIEGRLLGLPITICNHLQLDTLSLPADSLIDIDTDYFVAVPDDRAWIDPKNIFGILNNLFLNPPFITLSRSVSSGFMPLRYRFFADYLAALWEHRHEDSLHYERLFDLDAQLVAGKQKAVLAGCQNEIEDFPHCAATYYLLSLGEPDPEKANGYRHQAEKLCIRYRPDRLRSACQIPHRQLSVDLSTVIDLEKGTSDIQESHDQLGLISVALGLIYSACGQTQRAITQYEHGILYLGPHPELALEIGKLLLQQNELDRAIPFFQTGLQDDKTRTASHVFLGQLHAQKGLFARALEHLEVAHEMAPAWTHILSLLIELHKTLGNQQMAQSLLTEFKQQRQEILLLAREL